MDSNDPLPGADEKIESALREAAAAIGAARTLLEQGNVVDLQGLEAHVERACNAIPGLASDARERLKPALVALIDGLNGLGTQLSAQHQEISGTLQGISTRRQAVSAYKPLKSR